jgi:hypothetical protein
MKEPHKRYKEPTRNFVFTVTTPTLELNSVEYIDQLIQQHTHYQVIPSPLALNYDVEKIIASALPFTKYIPSHVETNSSISPSPSLLLIPLEIKLTISEDTSSMIGG